MKDTDMSHASPVPFPEVISTEFYEVIPFQSCFISCDLYVIR
jgi:hypothetical protein